MEAAFQLEDLLNLVKRGTGEAWYSRNTGLWYFLTDPGCKHSQLLPRSNERPKETERLLQHSLSVKTRRASAPI